MAFIRKIRRGSRVYLAEVENYRDGAKVRQRHIRFLGEDPESVNRNRAFRLDDITVDSVKIYGPVIVLESIARELGLYNLFGDNAYPILALVFAHCLDYKSVEATQEWFDNTDLSALMNCPKITSNALHEALSQLALMDFSSVEESVFEKFVALFGEDDSGTIYDATNTHLNGGLSTLAQKGKDKDGVRGRNLIQIGLGVTRRLGLPIFHQVHEGHVHDTKMFNEAIEKFQSLKYNPGLIVFDRGITSADCVSRLTKSGWKCLAGVPMHKGIKSYISNLDLDRMQSFKNLIQQGDTSFFVKSLPFTLGGSKGKLLILMNHMKKQRVKLERMRQIEIIKTQLKSSEEQWDTDVAKFFTKTGAINHHAVKRAEHYDGLSFLFTNAKLTMEESVRYYFAKDLIERCFKVSKSVLRIRPVRFILDEKIKSHVKICYISLVLITTIRVRLELAGNRSDPSRILKSLESIFKVNMTGTEIKNKARIPFSKVNTMTNHQKSMIKIIAPKLAL